MASSPSMGKVFSFEALTPVVCPGNRPVPPARVCLFFSFLQTHAFTPSRKVVIGLATGRPIDTHCLNKQLSGIGQEGRSRDLKRIAKIAEPACQPPDVTVAASLSITVPFGNDVQRPVLLLTPSLASPYPSDATGYQGTGSVLESLERDMHTRRRYLASTWLFGRTRVT